MVLSRLRITGFETADLKVFTREILSSAVSTITRGEMVEFFAWLQEDYLTEPDGVAPRGKFKLSTKTVKKIHTNLYGMWHWAADQGKRRHCTLRSRLKLMIG